MDQLIVDCPQCRAQNVILIDQSTHMFPQKVFCNNCGVKIFIKPPDERPQQPVEYPAIEHPAQFYIEQRNNALQQGGYPKSFKLANEANDILLRINPQDPIALAYQAAFILHLYDPKSYPHMELDKATKLLEKAIELAGNNLQSLEDIVKLFLLGYFMGVDKINIWIKARVALSDTYQIYTTRELVEYEDKYGHRDERWVEVEHFERNPECSFWDWHDEIAGNQNNRLALFEIALSMIWRFFPTESMAAFLFTEQGKQDLENSIAPLFAEAKKKAKAPPSVKGKGLTNPNYYNPYDLLGSQAHFKSDSIVLKAIRKDAATRYPKISKQFKKKKTGALVYAFTLLLITILIYVLVGSCINSLLHL